MSNFKNNSFECRGTRFQVDGQELVVSAGIFSKRGRDVIFSEPDYYGVVTLYMDGQLVGPLSESEALLLKAYIKQQRVINKERQECAA